MYLRLVVESWRICEARKESGDLGIRVSAVQGVQYMLIDAVYMQMLIMIGADDGAC